MSNPYNAPAADMSDVNDGSRTYDPVVVALSGRIGRLRYLSYTFLTSMAALLAIAIIGGVVSLINQKLGMAVMFLLYIPVIVLGF
ncbi:MAG: hypothetical protein Q7T55_26145, partial [Solirubrobacteraceae bacterium]|nr:hypothetical protein [Solirubrobacteraceae bacterium]